MRTHIRNTARKQLFAAVAAVGLLAPAMALSPPTPAAMPEAQFLNVFDGLFGQGIRCRPYDLDHRCSGAPEPLTPQRFRLPGAPGWPNW